MIRRTMYTIRGTGKHPLVFGKVWAEGRLVTLCSCRSRGVPGIPEGLHAGARPYYVRLPAGAARMIAAGSRERPPQVAAGENPLSGATDYSRGREYAGAGA